MSLRHFIFAALLFANSGGYGAAAEPERIDPVDPASLQRGIDAAYKSGLTKIVIPPGTYRVPPAKEYLRIENVSDFEIDATGVTLLRSDPTKNGIEFGHCHHVTLRGMTLLNETPPFTQAIIEAIEPTGTYYDVRICKGYPANFDDPHFFPKDPTGYLFDPKTRQWKANTTDISANRVERLGPDRFRLYWRGRAGPDRQDVAVGDEIAFRGVGSTDIFLGDCGDMDITGVTILHGGGFCVHEGDGEGNSHYTYTVAYGPRPLGAMEDPLIACNADGFHSSSVRHGPTLENCHFEGMPDDGVAIHGSFALVIESDPNSIVVLFRGGAFVRPGDPLRLFDKRGQFVDESVVTSLESVERQNTRQSKRPHFKESKRFYRLQLEHPLKGEFDDLVDDPSANGSNYVVRNCTIKNHRARGMLLKADNGLVENNVIDGSTMAGIVLSPELYWNEAGYSRNVTIRRNTVRHVGYQNSGRGMGQAGAITLRGEDEDLNAAATGADHFGHQNIVIEANTIEDCDGLNLLVSSASDVLVKDNKFVRPQAHPSKRGADHVDPGALIQIGPSRNVRIEGNSVVNRGPSGTQLVKTSTPQEVHQPADGVVELRAPERAEN